MVQRTWRLALVALTLGFLNGCRSTEPAIDLRQQLEAADWSKMETVTVTLN